MARRAARAGPCIGFLFAPALLNFVPGVGPHIRGKLLARSAEAQSAPDIVVNDDIKARRCESSACGTTRRRR